MNKFLNNKTGAILIITLALVYSVSSLVTGHQVSGEPPEDLSIDPEQLGLNIWQSASLIIEKGDELLVLDIRSAEFYKTFHIPFSVSHPGFSGKNSAFIASVILLRSSDGKTDGVPPPKYRVLNSGPSQTPLSFLNCTSFKSPVTNSPVLCNDVEKWKSQ